MHDVRYVLEVDGGHDRVRLRDQKTGEDHAFSGPRALYEALGVLADWRERDSSASCPLCGTVTGPLPEVHQCKPATRALQGFIETHSIETRVPSALADAAEQEQRDA